MNSKKQIEFYLFNKLVEISKKEGLYVKIDKNLQKNIWGNLHLSMDIDTLEKTFYGINVAKKHWGCPYVIAHELGHYYSIKSNDDFEEKSADIKANEIIGEVLSKEDLNIIGWPIKYYPLKLVKEFTLFGKIASLLGIDFTIGEYHSNYNESAI